MMDRRTRRAVTRLNSRFDRVFLAHAVGRQRAARTPWYRLPRLTVARVADAFSVPRQLATPEAEHWSETLLHRPVDHRNHSTIRIAGKSYHWRQDYTGQLKLTAGESPW